VAGVPADDDDCTDGAGRGFDELCALSCASSSGERSWGLDPTITLLARLRLNCTACTDLVVFRLRGTAIARLPGVADAEFVDALSGAYI